jgi:hypothetical protein
MTEAASLYSRLCRSWNDLDASVRRFHDNPVAARASGRFDIVHGGWAARIVSRLAGFPPAGSGLETEVNITPRDGGERWHRSFGGAPLVSEQRAGEDGTLIERVGRLELRFRLEAVRGSLQFHQVGASLCLGAYRIRLPTWLAPRVQALAYRDPDDGQKMRVQVEIIAPLVGKLLGYAGVLHSSAEAKAA